MKPHSAALEQSNKLLVLAFYEALALGEVDVVKELVASDLEWWFHGPQTEQHLMQSLAGVKRHDNFIFMPSHVRAAGNMVFVEGQAGIADAIAEDQPKCWVHVWTVEKGKLTQLREYFNAAVTVLLESLRPCGPLATVWKSQLWKASKGKSFPDFILAI